MSSYDLVKYRPFPADPLLNLYLQEATTVPFPDKRISHSAPVMHLFDYVFDSFFDYDLHKDILSSLGTVQVGFLKSIISEFLRDRDPSEETRKRIQDVLYAITRSISAHRSKSALTINYGSRSFSSSHPGTPLIRNAITFLFEERQSTLKELNIFSDYGDLMRMSEARPVIDDIPLLFSNQLEHLTLSTSLSACQLGNSISSFTNLEHLSVNLFPIIMDPFLRKGPLILPKSLKKLIFTINSKKLKSQDTSEFSEYFQRLHVIDEITINAEIGSPALKTVLNKLLGLLLRKSRILTFTGTLDLERRWPPTIVKTDTDISILIGSLPETLR